MSLQVLERPKPPEPDEALLDDVQAYIERFIDLPTPSHGRVLAVWLVHTYSCDVFYVTPYLYISSKGPEAGKTKLMDVLASLALNPDWATDAPTHVIAQEIEASRPTLFVDEADTTFRPGSPNTGLKRVFNIGYEKGPGSVIKRQRGNEPKRWSVYCAKCLAGIRNNHLPDSLLTRCIPIEMVKRSREVERFNKFHMARDRERIELADRIATFAETFATEMALARPEPMKALGDRHNEIVEPLLAIAGVLGREQEVRDALAHVFCKRDREVSQEQTLLARIRGAFVYQDALAGHQVDKVHTDDILPFVGPGSTARSLGIVLAECGFDRTGPETFRIGNQNRRGYWRRDLEPLWERYLDPAVRLVDNDDELEEVA